MNSEGVLHLASISMNDSGLGASEWWRFASPERHHPRISNRNRNRRLFSQLAGAQRRQQRLCWCHGIGSHRPCCCFHIGLRSRWRYALVPNRRFVSNLISGFLLFLFIYFFYIVLFFFLFLFCCIKPTISGRLKTIETDYNNSLLHSKIQLSLHSVKIITSKRCWYRFF